MRGFQRRSAEPERCLLVDDLPDPRPGVGDVLVRVSYAGVCGTDLHAYRSEGDYRNLPVPLVLGHEFAGVVTDVGDDVPPARIGARIVARVIQHCGRCTSCASGMEHLCPNRAVPGITYDGGFADLVVLPERHVVDVPPTMDLRTAALTEPLSVAVHAVERALAGSRLAPRAAVVTGPGAIGLMCAVLLHRHGYDVVVVGTDRDRPTRLAAAEAAGFPTAVVGAAGYTGPPIDAASVWIEASGANAALAMALDCVAPAGVVCAVGIAAEPFQHLLAPATRREVSLLFSMASGPADYAAAADLLAHDPGSVLQFVDEFEFSECASALAAAGSGSALKPLMSIGGER